MENGPFIDDFPIKTSHYKGFSMAMLNNQMVLYTRKWSILMVHVQEKFEFQEHYRNSWGVRFKTRISWILDRIAA